MKKYGKWIAAGLGIGAAAFGSVLVARAIKFKPKESYVPSGTEIDLDEEKIVKDMQEMIRCKTVSYADVGMRDEAEFEKFRNLLPKLFPNVHDNCSRQFIGDSGILYRWMGKEEGDPVVLMSHYDVVPVEEDQWEKPPFEAILEMARSGAAAHWIPKALSAVLWKLRND